MAIMKPKVAPPTIPKASAEAYHTNLAKAVEAYKPQITGFLNRQGQYQTDVKNYNSALSSWNTNTANYNAALNAYNSNLSSWQSQLNQAQNLVNNLEGKNLTSLGQQVLNQRRANRDAILAARPSAPAAFTTPRPTAPAAFTETQPAAPAGTKFSNGALSYFNPSTYGVSGLSPELGKVKSEYKPNESMKNPLTQYNISEMSKRLSNEVVIDPSKLGTFGDVLRAMTGSTTKDMVYIPKEQLAAMSSAYKDYGMGDLKSAVLPGTAWDLVQPALGKIVQLPRNYEESMAAGETVYAKPLSASSGSGTSALGQLLRKTHGTPLQGVQGDVAQQALTQQLYGSGGLSTIGRMLSQGTNESLGGISNPMLRGMLSQQLYD